MSPPPEQPPDSLPPTTSIKGGGHPALGTNTYMPRRRFVQGSAALGTMAFWLENRNSPAGRALAEESRQAYRPQFFTADEYHFLELVSEHILPRDEHGPGGIDLGVAEFIDRQMDTPYANGALWYMMPPFAQGPVELGYQLPYCPRALYRKGIDFLNQHCQSRYQAPFIALDDAAQANILHALEDDTIMLDDIAGSVFFEQLRSNILEGAFADPLYGGNKQMQGWVMLGFPGARADFMEWINQEGAQYPYGPVSIPVAPDQTGISTAPATLPADSHETK